MGTRALIHIKDRGDTLVTVYRQYDGYPSGLGDDIHNAIAHRTLVNGFGQNKFTVANGMGCLAALLIACLKGAEAGNVYIQKPDATDCGEEYVYTLFGDTMTPSGGVTMRVETCPGSVVWEGQIHEWPGGAKVEELMYA